MINKCHIIVCFFILVSINFVSWGQDIESMLNVCCRVLEDRNEALYDDVENYLQNVDQDSIKSSLYIESFYHIALGKLYIYKYNDWSKSANECEYLLSMLEPYKHLDEYHESYKASLYLMGVCMMNTGEFERAEKFFSRFVIEAVDDVFDSNLLLTLSLLSQIYENNDNKILAEECHKKSQLILINRYIKVHPEHNFYLENFKTLSAEISKAERKKTTNTEYYINCLCSLGVLIHKIDFGDYYESMHLFHKALVYSKQHDLYKSSGLDECFSVLLEIYIKNVNEPLKSDFVQGITPIMMEYYNGKYYPYEIYYIISSTYEAYKQYNKALFYGEKALAALGTEEKSNIEELKKIYKHLVYCYLYLSSDSGNKKAYDYLQKLEAIINEDDTEYYDWAIELHGIVLRYLYQSDQAIKYFNDSLSYFAKKYGINSEEYISTLNQLGLTFSDIDKDKSFSYLTYAKELIGSSDNINDMTIKGVCTNLARYYIANNKSAEAIKELEIVKAIELKYYGELSDSTNDLINQCY